MDNLLLNDFITMTVYGSCMITALYLFFRDQFRISNWKVMLLWLVPYFINSGITIINTIYIEIPFKKSINRLIGFFPEIILLFVLKENIVNRYCFFELWRGLMNLIQTTMLAACMSVYGIINGKLSWYVKNEAGISMLFITLIMTILGTLISYEIMIHFRNDVESLNGIRRVVLMIMTCMNKFVMLGIKPLFTDETVYRNDPQGAGLVCDTVSAVLIFVAFIWIICIHGKKIRHKRREIAESVESDLLMYEKTEELQQEVREASHEINNLKQIDGGKQDG